MEGPILEVVIAVPVARGSAEAAGEVNYLKKTVRYSSCEELPEEIMSQMQNIIGDGRARVTVAVDMAVKDYGTGAGAMVSVSVVCNQDEQTIQNAANLAGYYARFCVEQQRKLAEDDLNKIRQAAQGAPQY